MLTEAAGKNFPERSAFKMGTAVVKHAVSLSLCLQYIYNSECDICVALSMRNSGSTEAVFLRPRSRFALSLSLSPMTEPVDECDGASLRRVPPSSSESPPAGPAPPTRLQSLVENLDVRYKATIVVPPML